MANANEIITYETESSLTTFDVVVWWLNAFMFVCCVGYGVVAITWSLLVPFEALFSPFAYITGFLCLLFAYVELRSQVEMSKLEVDHG